MNLSNDSLATNASGQVPSSATSPAEPSVIITVAVLSIVGNPLVIVVTIRRQTFPSASRLFIASMACSDLILGSTFPAMVAPAEAGEWVYSDKAARVCAAIGLSSTVLSFYALGGLNLDRLYALMNDGVGISCKKARIFLISAWAGIYAWFIFSTVYGVPLYYDPAIALTTYDVKTHLWFTIVTLGMLFSPIVLTLYCVVRTLKALCTQHEPQAAAVVHIIVNGPGGVPPQNANPQQQPAPQNINTDNSDRSYAKIVLILTLVQTIMPLPVSCAFIASQLGYDLPTFLFWSSWLAMSNTFLDVDVYIVCQKSFRKAVKEIATFVASFLYKKCCCQNRVEVADQQNIQMSSL